MLNKIFFKFNIGAFCKENAIFINSMFFLIRSVKLLQINLSPSS